MTDTLSKRLFSSLSDRIPQEIWANIFLECIPSPQSTRSSPLCAPMLLCQVNRAWRSIALSLSELWSSISVEVSEDTDIEQMVEGIRTWLGRSGIRPLAISLHLGREVRLCGLDVDLDPILDLFISFIERWEEVQWELQGPFAGFVSSIHLLHAPLLKRFEVDFNDDNPEVMEPIFSMLSHSPHFTDFTWYIMNRYPQFHIAQFTIPWSQLTRFKTDCSLGVKECLKVFHLCPSLIDCTFECIYDGRSPTSLHNMSIIHDRLRTLTIGGPHRNMDQFFDHITLPNLSAFALEPGLNYYHDWPQDSFASFLSRSCCSVQTFKFHTAALSSDQFMELLCLLPTLTELYIEGDESHAIGDELLRNLTYDETVGGSCLCPQLQVITIAGFIASSKGMLAKMLKSRCRSNSSRHQIECLGKATVVLFGGWDGVWIYSEELEAIRDELDVAVIRVYPKSHTTRARWSRF